MIKISKPTMKIMTFILSLYLGITLCGDLVTIRHMDLLSNRELLTIGGFISILFFLLPNFVNEIYGFTLAFRMVKMGILVQILLFLLSFLFFKEEMHILFMNLLSVIGLFFSGYFNVRLFSVAKNFVSEGPNKYWVNSLGSYVFSEGIYSIYSIILLEIIRLPVKNIILTILVSYILKSIFAFILVGFLDEFLIYLKYKRLDELY